MKKLALALVLALAPALAWGQCTGIFPNNTVCGNASGSGNVPGPTPATSFPVTTPFANPTVAVGLSAVNGSATTAMRSDAAPPLSSSVQTSLTGTNHGVLLGTGAFGVNATAVCTTGQVLAGNTGADPTCQSISSLAVSSVTNSDGTLTISPTTGAVIASINLAHANTWTADQTIGNGSGLFNLILNGSQFTANQGPRVVWKGNSNVLGEIGTDCNIIVTTCNADIVFAGPGTSRKVDFWDWQTVNVNTLASYAPTLYISGALQASAHSANSITGGNAIAAYTVDDSGVRDFSTAVTALVNAQQAGNTVWGGFYECDLIAAVECTSIEGTIGNTDGAPNAPPAAGVNPTQPFATAIRATVGGAISNSLGTTFNASAGLYFPYYLGKGGKQFLYGIYLTEGAVTDHGIMINATPTLSPTTTAEFRNNGAGTGLIIKNVSSTSANFALNVQDSSGLTKAGIEYNGTYTANGTAGVSCSGSPTASFASVNGIVTHC